MRKWIIDVIIFAALVCGAASYGALGRGDEDGLPAAGGLDSAGPESAEVLTRTFHSSGVSAHAALLQARVSLGEAPSENDIEAIRVATGSDVRVVSAGDDVWLYATLCVVPEADIIEGARDTLVGAVSPWGPHTLAIAVTGVCPQSDFRAVQSRLEQNLYAAEDGVPYEDDGLSAKSLVSPLLMAGAQVAARQRDDDVLVYIGTPLIPTDF